ncbi:MAG: hypothetical protein LQ346_008637, partial [Caloplaca aetnensis]
MAKPVANNPHLQQQQQVIQQQQMQQRLRQQQMMQAQMGQNSGMVMGHGNNPMNPAQFRTSQGNPNVPRPPVSLPNHLQQAQAQVTREQQQQQQQQQLVCWGASGGADAAKAHGHGAVGQMGGSGSIRVLQSLQELHQQPDWGGLT